jgi:hypothetical protein
MKSELLSKTPACLLALFVTTGIIIISIERKQNCSSFLPQKKTALLLNRKKTKLIKFPVH